MASANKITVDVEATVTEATVCRCLKIIEWWLNDNPDKAIRGGIRHDDGLVDPLEICESNTARRDKKG